MTRAQAIRDLLELFCGKQPPIKIGNIKKLSRLSDGDYWRLQCWVANNLRPQWATGIDVLEAIDSIVDGAEGNGEERFKYARPLFAGLRGRASHE